MWNSRPTRIPSSQGGNAKIAGVCEGIGVRYQIDPTLIRILFVATALVGGGIGVYLVAWLIMPRYSTQYSPIEAVLKDRGPEYKKEKETGWWLIVALILFGFGAFNDPDNIFGGSSLVALAIAFGAWYLLHMRQPEPPNVEAGLISPAPGFTAPTPPAWDPLGAAPQLWHLPEPGTTIPEPAPKKKSHAWVWIVGAVIVVGLVSAVNNIPLVSVDESHDIRTVVRTEADLQSIYENGVGNLEVDLRDLEPLSTDRTIRIDNGIGNVDLILPAEVPVHLECNNGVGNSECQPGLHNPSEGHVLTIKIDNGIGNIGVTY